MPEQDPYIGEGGGGPLEEPDKPQNKQSGKDYYDDKPLKSPSPKKDNLGLTLFDRPGNNDPLGIGHHTKIDVSRYEKYLGPKTSYEKFVKDREYSNVLKPPAVKDTDYSVGLDPFFWLPVSVTIYSTDGKIDYQVTFSTPKVKAGPGVAVYHSFGDSGYVWGVQIGFDAPFNLGGISAGAGINVTDPWKSEFPVQIKGFKAGIQTKITIEEIRDGTRNYLKEVEQGIRRLYGLPPYP